MEFRERELESVIGLSFVACRRSGEKRRKAGK
jgi:hypothetical protein